MKEVEEKTTNGTEEKDTFLSGSKASKSAAQLPTLFAILATIIAFSVLIYFLLDFEAEVRSAVSGTLLGAVPLATQYLCNDPYEAGYMINDTTWISTVRKPCAFRQDYRSALKASATSERKNIEFLRGKSIVMIGDILDQEMARLFCAQPGFEMIKLKQPVGDYEYDDNFRGAHIICRNKEMDVTVVSFIIFAMSPKTAEKSDFDWHHREGEPKLAWDRVEQMLYPMLVTLGIEKPTLVTLNSGYWNFWVGDVDERAPVFERAAEFNEGMHGHFLPTVKRLFPKSMLAFRHTPYAQHHGRFSMSRLVGLYNTLVDYHSRVWRIPVFRHRSLILGMYHMYKEDHLRPNDDLNFMYVNLMFYYLEDALTHRRPLRFELSMKGTC